MRDQLRDGWSFHLFNVVETSTASRSPWGSTFRIPSLRIIKVLERIIESRDRPDAICCGNGAENISSLIEAWAGAERFNRIVRYECLIHYCWDDLDGGRLFATRWMYKFNHQRPHMALGDFIPKQRLAMAAGHELMVSGCYTQSFISNYHCRL